MKKILIISAVVTAMLGSCSTENPLINNNNNSLKIKVGGIATKSIKSVFANNDSIKVFITGTGYTPTLTAYKYNSTGAGTWSVYTGNTDIMLTGNDATVYAYYPCSLTAPTLSSSGTLPISIPAVDDMLASATTDVLWATPVTQVNNKNSGTSNLANLQFRHALAKISFVIVKDATYSSDPSMGVIDTISITSPGSKIVNTGTANLAAGTFTAGSPTIGSVIYAPGATTHINQTGSNAVTAYALIAPVNYTSGDLVLKIKIDGKMMTVSNFPTQPDWSSANTNYQYTITVKATGLVVSDSSNIIDWGTTNSGNYNAQ